MRRETKTAKPCVLYIHMHYNKCESYSILNIITNISTMLSICAQVYTYILCVFISAFTQPQMHFSTLLTLFLLIIIIFLSHSVFLSISLSLSLFSYSLTLLVCCSCDDKL